jgi:hypothetical protein
VSAVRRLRPIDRVLLPTLTLLWVVCFALGVRTQIRGGPLAPSLELSVESDASYPVLTGAYAQIVHPTDPLAPAGLRPGDRLLRVGDADLRGVGTFGFSGRALDEAGRGLRVPLLFERNGQRLETSLGLPPVSGVLPVLAASFAFAASAFFLLLRARPTRSVLAWAYFALSFAIPASNFPASGAEVYVWMGMFALNTSLFYPLLLRFQFLFPDDREPAGRWHRTWPWLFVAQGGFAALAFSGRTTLGTSGFMAIAVLGALAILVVATRKYRAADLVERRQVK